ncbi:glycerophosphodiester phosphodiesterase [Blautia hansenii]|uniref:glycerophosphodiester phosphodiesterase n=1 Tax=Blautia hansenii TaxID=1322 RepID=UPI0022E1F70B|nr:glycerophosphodiester phosphodiesterase [Blautia hansenii]
MKKILKQTWKTIRYNIRSLLIFEAGYRAATFFLVMQLVRFFVDFSLKQQGFSYLTAENYKEFLQYPLSVVFLALVFLVILIFYFVEVAALLCGFVYSAKEKKLYAGDFFILGIKKTVSFFRHSKVSWLVCAACSGPFLAAYFLVREISYIQILEFTARQIYKEIKSPMLIYGFLGVLLLISFLFVFALPYCILEKKKNWQGFLSGMKLFRTHWKRILLDFCFLHVFMLLFILITYSVVMLILAAGVFFFKPEAVKISSIFIYSEYVNMALGIYAGGVQLIGSIAFVYTVYTKFHIQPKDEEEHLFYKKMEQYFWYSKLGRRKAAGLLTALFVLLEGIYFGFLVINHDTTLSHLAADTEITAHRGGAWKAPENTISALQYTIDSGADYAEVDVQETKDGELILLHDDSLKRTAGVKKNVWDMTLKQIEKLDAGASFHKKFRGEKIPEFTEVLKFCKGRLDLNIEIKYNGKNKGIVNKVVRAIKENHFEDHCVVTSMNYQFLKQIKKIAPEIRTGYIMTMTYGGVQGMEAADFFSVKHTYVDEKFVTQAHALGKEVYVWTVNYKGDAKRMLDIGADNIITDDPIMVRKVQNRESGSSTGYVELLKYAFRF